MAFFFFLAKTKGDQKCNSKADTATRGGREGKVCVCVVLR